VLDAAEGREIAQRGIGDHDDVAAASTVPAVGPALGDVLLAPEAQAAVTAAAGLDVDLRPVVERHFASRRNA
jgi:hypothetical protein